MVGQLCMVRTTKFGANRTKAAGYNGHLEVVALLLGKGGDPSIKNQAGRTARQVSFRLNRAQQADRKPKLKL